MALEVSIEGVDVKELKSHGDERGFFREILRSSDAAFADSVASKGVFGQWSHSKMAKDVVKAWHYHHIQTDWWYIPFGIVQTVLYDNRPESKTYKNKMVFLMGDKFAADEKFDAAAINEVTVRIPPGVLHGLKVLSNEGAHIMYITSITYDPNEEGRFTYNSAFVGHDWGADVIVVDNDKRDFVPHSTRVLLR